MFALLYRIRKSTWAGYFFPLPVCLLAWAGHLVLFHAGVSNAPYVTFFLALAVTAILGGIGPGLLTLAILEVMVRSSAMHALTGASMPVGTPIAAAVLAVIALIIILLTNYGTSAAINLDKATTKLRAVNETLEARIEERTGALLEAEEKLRQAQKMEAVGQLSGGIAHDFNNLLTGIMASLERLQTRLPYNQPEELTRYIHSAQDAAIRASSLTHRLLAFSRRQPLKPRGTDMNQMVAGMAELISRTIGPFITLEFAPDAGLHATLVDPNQLEHALLNLCINGADAMPEGGVLRIATANSTLGANKAAQLHLPEGDYVTLTVTDTGTGMTPEVLARAFDPFFTTKPPGRGTGLGLSMIYGFTRQSGGHVAIVSTPRTGTNVTLYLPRHLAGVEEAEEPALPAQTAMPASRGETILLVDDEPSIRVLAAEVLEEQGYKVHQAAEGTSAMEVLCSGAPVDLLITDLGLPGIHGRELATSGLALHPHLKVLFITGFMESAPLCPAPLTPAMRVLSKPFQLSALPTLVHEILDS